MSGGPHLHLTLTDCHECGALSLSHGDNYRTESGYPVFLCGVCWDEADGLVCDLCDHLADSLWETDTWADCNAGVPWVWPEHAVVCFHCARPTIDAFEGVAR